MKKLNLNKKGFTLVELLAVIVILALLIVVVANTAIPAMNSAKENSLDIYTKRVVEQIKGQFMSYEIQGRKEVDETGIKCETPAGGTYTCTFSSLSAIMGPESENSFSLKENFVISALSTGGYNISGGLASGSLELYVRTNASTGKISYSKTA